MASPPPAKLQDLLKQCLDLSGNGIAVLDALDQFIYYNDAFSKLFGFDNKSMMYSTYDDLTRWMYVHKGGINIDWPSLESWQEHVRSRRRTSQFRSFETDLIDGRWLLMTEQICPGGEMAIFCSDITRQKATELALRKAHEDIERLALTDDLTGVANRRNFMQLLNQELYMSKRHGRPWCLAMIDLDFFKQVNDNYGHDAGDDVLKHFAAFLKLHLRAGDILGRLGGEEFAVVLLDVGLPDALHALNRIAELLRLERLESIASDFKYTFSGGMLQYRADSGLDGNGLLKKADRAMYEAKATGRDRIAVGSCLAD